jgi:CubicO group peptidase (beta-lactamase class C family)
MKALERFADGHNRRGHKVPHWDLPSLAGAGALRSTTADLLRFLGLQLRPPATLLGRAALATHEPRARRRRLTQGLGWVSLPLHSHDRRVLSHNGGTVASAALPASSPRTTPEWSFSPIAHAPSTQSASDWSRQ